MRSVCYSYFPYGTNILVIGGQSCIVSVEIVGSKATAAVGIIPGSPQMVHLGPQLARTPLQSIERDSVSPDDAGVNSHGHCCSSLVSSPLKQFVSSPEENFNKRCHKRWFLTPNG